jgi:hypothetical protein
VWEGFKARKQMMTQEFEQLQQLSQQQHVRQAMSNRDFVSQVQNLPSVQAALAQAHRTRQQEQQRKQQEQ